MFNLIASSALFGAAVLTADSDIVATAIYVAAGVINFGLGIKRN